MTDFIPIGVHHDVDERTYFTDPALSQSAARHLLDCPARYIAHMSGARKPRTAFDVGHALHELVLGVGGGIELIDAPDWRTKAAREARDAARKAGRAPMLAEDYATVTAMAHAVKLHPMGGALLHGPGHSEVSLRWDDPETGVPCRGRIDRVTTDTHGRTWLVDLKSTLSAKPETFARKAYDYDYPMQAEWYRSGWEALTGERPGFAFVAVEKEPPHFVSAGVLDARAEEVGAERMSKALATWQHCQETDQWPAYPDDLTTYPSPHWA